MIPTLYVMIGIQGSGKSTTAKELQNESGAFLLSSDQIRTELFGNEEDQSDNNKVFETLYHRARFHLEHGSDVIVDAMNISRKKRVHILTSEFGKTKCTKKAIYMVTPFKTCLERDANRERTVGERILSRTYRQMQPPTYSEGWDDISYADIDSEVQNWRCVLDYLDSPISNYDNFIGNLNNYIDGFGELYDFEQDNQNHQYSLGMHTFETFKNVKKILSGDIYGEYSSYDYGVLLLSAIFHDMGKVHTKQFRDPKGNPTEFAHYYDHQNVSSQIAVEQLLKLGMPYTVVHDVSELVLHHMSLYMKPKKDGTRKVEHIMKPDMYKLLLVLNEADRSAH